MSLQRRLIVDLIRALRELAGDAFQAVPSSEASFTGGETRQDTGRYYQATGVTSHDRIKLIWDFVGTEFVGRQLQYEMFYSAAHPVVNTRMFRPTTGTTRAAWSTAASASTERPWKIP